MMDLNKGIWMVAGQLSFIVLALALFLYYLNGITFTTGLYGFVGAISSIVAYSIALGDSNGTD